MTEQKTQNAAEKYLLEIKDGKRSMKAHWLPEVGVEIPLVEFHKQAENEELLNPRVILGHFPHAAGGDPYDPRDKFAWGVRKSDGQILYTIIPFNPQKLAEDLSRRMGGE